MIGAFEADNFQSNHTGIETGCRGIFRSRSVFFQSNHTGIETQRQRQQSQQRQPSNRTILELKPQRSFQPVQANNFQSNHTGIETIAPRIAAASFLPLPIEPYWN